MATRKRKRSTSDANEPGSLSLELSSVPVTQVGPALGVYGRFLHRPTFSFLILLDSANFPSLTPPKNTAFNTFVREEDEGTEFVKRLSTIAGGSDAVEFSGSTNEGSDGIGSRFRFFSRRSGRTTRSPFFIEQILSRTASTGVVESYPAPHSTVSDVSSSQSSQELQADGTWYLRAFASAQRARRGIWDKKG